MHWAHFNLTFVFPTIQLTTIKLSRCRYGMRYSPHPWASLSWNNRMLLLPSNKNWLDWSPLATPGLVFPLWSELCETRCTIFFSFFLRQLKGEFAAILLSQSELIILNNPQYSSAVGALLGMSVPLRALVRELIKIKISLETKWKGEKTCLKISTPLDNSSSSSLLLWISEPLFI